jgi:hypothetical protein
MAHLEQRNQYKGSPSRPWVRLQLVDPAGEARQVELVADTGSPFALIIDATNMASLKQGDGPDVNTNFGPLAAGRVRIAIPDLSFVDQVLGYASDSVCATVRKSSADFHGLVGLPLLRLLEYGGDSDYFWIRAKA